jgi:hypothetical protein
MKTRFLSIGRWLVLVMVVMNGVAHGQLRVVSMPHSYYPPVLLNAGIFSGEVDLMVTVGADGKVSDALVVGYTQVELTDLATYTIKETEFAPVMKNGMATSVRSRMTLSFSAEGVVISQTAGENQFTRMQRMLSPRRVNRIGMLGELDQAPQPINRPSPGRPADQSRGMPTRVTIDFLIDEDGRVRMPVLDQGEHGPWAEAATAALLEWRFSPPTRQGKPVIVNAKQEFIFPP